MLPATAQPDEQHKPQVRFLPEEQKTDVSDTDVGDVQKMKFKTN